MKVSVICAVKDRLTAFERCLYSWKSQVYPDFEFIVVDDGSKEDVLSMAKNYFPDVKYKRLESMKDRTPAVAWNEGFKLSEGDFVIFTGCDLILSHNDAIQDILDSYRGNRVSVLTYFLSPEATNALDSIPWRENPDVIMDTNNFWNYVSYNQTHANHEIKLAGLTTYVTGQMRSDWEFIGLFRDEERRIVQFCQSYADADKILVADGGSLDNTIEIAKTFPNVEVRNFTERWELENGYWRNNDSAHANFLFAWAYELKPDWIIYDDCDCRPNYLVKQDYRKILSETDKNFVMITRLYLWGMDKHFPFLAKPEVNHGYYEPSLWAWRGNIDFWTVDVPPAYTFRIGDKAIKDLHFDSTVLDLMPPYCLMHYSWDEEERVNEKLKIYRESGLIPEMKHPLEFGGPLEDLPEWAHE